jgi:hypothetical protein
MRIYHDETGRTEEVSNHLADLQGNEWCSVRFCPNHPHPESLNRGHAGLCAEHELEAAMNFDERDSMTQEQTNQAAYWIEQLILAGETQVLEGYLSC